MRFVVCWTCGYSTPVRGGGAGEARAARSLLEKHDCGGSDREIITKEELE